MAYKRLEIEPVLGMTLDPAVLQISTPEYGHDVYDSLNGVTTPAGARCDCAIRVDLGVLVEGIFPAILKVDKGLTAPVLGDGIREI